MTTWLRSIVVATLVCFATLSCTGSGNSQSDATSGGDEGTGIAIGGGSEGTGITSAKLFKGTISAFSTSGSLIVNGVEIDIANANVQINDTDSTPAELAIGMVVTVAAQLDKDGTSLVANNVSFDQDLEGPISNIERLNTENTRLTILGVSVDVVPDTVLKDVTVDSLAVNQIVAVSGYRQADRTLIATRIEKKADTFVAGETAELEGTIDSFDIEQKLITIGELIIDISQAVLDDLNEADLVNGLFVEIKGRSFTEDGLLEATHIEREDVVIVDENLEVKIEGFITDFESVSKFTISGYVIDASEAVFDKGIPSDLANNLFVEIEGVVDEDGIIIVNEIKIESLATDNSGDSDSSDDDSSDDDSSDDDSSGDDSSDDDSSDDDSSDDDSSDDDSSVGDSSDDNSSSANNVESAKDIRITAPIQSIDVAAKTISLLNITAEISVVTTFQDNSAMDSEFLQFVDLAVNDWLEVEGSLSENAAQLDKIKRIDPEDEVELRASVQSISDTTVNLAGINVDLFEFPELLALMTVGLIIEVDGLHSAGTILVNEVQIED